MKGCHISGCNRERHKKSRCCYVHYRERRNEQKSKQRSAAKVGDPDYFGKVAAYKRGLSRRNGLIAACTQAYIANGLREEKEYELALKRWLREVNPKPLRTPEQLAAEKREQFKRRYTANPEKERQRARTYKHSNPEYRAKWNDKRGQLEQELSDGTLTREAVQQLFAASKRCPYCGDPYQHSRRSLDHITPLAEANGRKLHSLANVLICCYDCNIKKRTKSLGEFLEELKRRPLRKRTDAAKPGKASRLPGLFATHD